MLEKELVIILHIQLAFSYRKIVIKNFVRVTLFIPAHSKLGIKFFSFFFWRNPNIPNKFLNAYFLFLFLFSLLFCLITNLIFLKTPINPYQRAVTYMEHIVTVLHNNWPF